MAYFNWNICKILKIFLFSMPTRGEIPLFGAEWGGGAGSEPDPLVETPPLL